VAGRLEIGPSVVCSGQVGVQQSVDLAQVQRSKQGAGRRCDRSASQKERQSPASMAISIFEFAL
jgi:hypothetical protein